MLPKGDVYFPTRNHTCLININALNVFKVPTYIHIHMYTNQCQYTLLYTCTHYITSDFLFSYILRYIREFNKSATKNIVDGNIIAYQFRE